MDIIGLRDGSIRDIEMSVFDSSLRWWVCGCEYCVGFTCSVENGLEFWSGVPPEGAVDFLVNDVVLIEFLSYIIGDVIGDFRGLVSSVCVDDSYFRDAVFWSVCQLGCEAPLGELDACVVLP